MAVQMELIQPLTGYSMYDDFRAAHGEGIHHVKFLETNCQAALARYRRQGFEVVQSGKFDEDEFYYLNTEPVFGIIIEIGNGGRIRSPERRYPAGGWPRVRPARWSHCHCGRQVTAAALCPAPGLLYGRTAIAGAGVWHGWSRRA